MTVGIVVPIIALFLIGHKDMLGITMMGSVKIVTPVRLHAKPTQTAGLSSVEKELVIALGGPLELAK